MSAPASQVLAAGISRTSTGEEIAFWLVAVIAVTAAIGLVTARHAVHAALLLVVDLFCVAICYALENAIFLAVVEVTVYAGAIMILFLFVLMLIGVDSSDSLVETLRGQRFAALVLAAGVAALLVGFIGNAVSHTHALGLSNSNNVQGIARLLFTTYLFPFEATSALLVTAAVGAMVLGHRERLVPRLTQRQLVEQRFTGSHPSPLPGPGVFALHDSVDTQALLPDGSPDPGSVARAHPVGVPTATGSTDTDPGTDSTAGEAQ